MQEVKLACLETEASGISLLVLFLQHFQFSCEEEAVTNTKKLIRI